MSGIQLYQGVTSNTLTAKPHITCQLPLRTCDHVLSCTVPPRHQLRAIRAMRLCETPCAAWFTRSGYAQRAEESHGGLFCDPPGLGKTITALGLVMRTRGRRPASAVGAQGSGTLEEDQSGARYWRLDAGQVLQCAVSPRRGGHHLGVKLTCHL